MAESQSGVPAKEKGIRGALTKIITRGLAKYLGTDLGVPITENANEEARVGRLRAWFDEKKRQVSETVKGAVKDSILDDRIQEFGAEYVRESIAETVSEARSGFAETLDDTAKNLSEETSEDRRSTYQKIRTLLGENKDDKWYQRLGKSILARAGSVGFPIIALISARLAAKFTGDKTQEDVEGYAGKFDTIYRGLMSKLTPSKTTEPTVKTA